MEKQDKKLYEGLAPESYYSKHNKVYGKHYVIVPNPGIIEKNLKGELSQHDVEGRTALQRAMDAMKLNADIKRRVADFPEEKELYGKEVNDELRKQLFPLPEEKLADITKELADRKMNKRDIASEKSDFNFADYIKKLKK
jgi:hypothetical protein